MSKRPTYTAKQIQALMRKRRIKDRCCPECGKYVGNTVVGGGLCQSCAMEAWRARPRANGVKKARRVKIVREATA